MQHLSCDKMVQLLQQLNVLIAFFLFLVFNQNFLKNNLLDWANEQHLNQGNQAPDLKRDAAHKLYLFYIKKEAHRTITVLANCKYTLKNTEFFQDKR